MFIYIYHGKKKFAIAVIAFFLHINNLWAQHLVLKTATLEPGIFDSILVLHKKGEIYPDIYTEVPRVLPVSNVALFSYNYVQLSDALELKRNLTNKKFLNNLEPFFVSPYNYLGIDTSRLSAVFSFRVNDSQVTQKYIYTDDYLRCKNIGEKILIFGKKYSLEETRLFLMPPFMDEIFFIYRDKIYVVEKGKICPAAKFLKRRFKNDEFFKKNFG